MPRIHPDFSREAKPISDGQYICKIVDAKEGSSQKTGDHFVRWELEVLNGSSRLNYVTMTQGPAAGMFRHMVHAAGIENYKDSDIDTDTLIGKFILADVKNEDFIGKDGETRQSPKVKKISKVDPKDLLEAQASFQQFTDEDIPF